MSEKIDEHNKRLRDAMNKPLDGLMDLGPEWKEATEFPECRWHPSKFWTERMGFAVEVRFTKPHHHVDGETHYRKADGE